MHFAWAKKLQKIVQCRADGEKCVLLNNESVQNKTCMTHYNVITSIFHLNTAPLKFETDSVSVAAR